MPASAAQPPEEWACRFERETLQARRPLPRLDCQEDGRELPGCLEVRLGEPTACALSRRAAGRAMQPPGELSIQRRSWRSPGPATCSPGAVPEDRFPRPPRKVLIWPQLQ